MVDVKNLTTTSGIKRTKPPKKIIPNKILKPNIDQGRPELEHTGCKEDSSEEESKLSLVEPEIVVSEGLGVQLKTEPEEYDHEGETLSEHSLEIDMSSMVDTSMGESSSLGGHSQGPQVCWQSDTKPFGTDTTHAPGQSSILAFERCRQALKLINCTI